MIQLVVSGNRIVAHGEDCFLAMGGTVVCTVTGRVFQNATVVNHDGAIPCDIDQVGYEYHAGEFVPCAPYGKGTGNFAVVCDDCKTIKDSGISASSIGKVAVVDFIATSSGGSITVDFVPRFAFISISSLDSGANGTSKFAVVTACGGILCASKHRDTGGVGESTITGCRSTVSENTITFGGLGLENGAKCTAIVVGGV